MSGWANMEGCRREAAATHLILWIRNTCNYHYQYSFFLINPIAVQLGNISVFYKQRGNLFYPVTSFSLPTILLRIPLSAVSAMLWTLMTYFVVGFAPDPGRQSPCLLASRHIVVYMQRHQGAGNSSDHPSVRKACQMLAGQAPYGRGIAECVHA